MARGFGTTFKFEADATDKMSAPLGRATGSTIGLQKALNGTSGSMEGLGALGSAMPGLLGPAVSSAGALASALGPIAIGLGLAMAAFGAFNGAVETSTQLVNRSTDAFARYQTALAEVQTILGVTRAEMESTGSAALDFAATYGKDAQAELQGFYQTASAGFADAADAATIMDATNKLAVGGVTDLMSASDLLTTVLNAYGIEAENAEDATDTLFTAIRAGKTNATALAGSMGNVVSSAAAAGATLEETTAAMAAQTLAGQSTAEAATALGRAFDLLIKQPKQLTDAFAKFGIETEDLNIRERGLLPVIQDIGRAFAGNEEELARAIPQIRAFKAIMPLATTQADKFVEILDQMNNKAGETDKAFKTVADTMQFQKQRWEAVTDGIRIRLGSVFAPAMTKTMDLVNDVLGLIEKLPPSMKDTIFAFVGIGLAMPAVVGKLSGFVFAVVKVGAALAVVVGLLSAFGPALGLTGTMLGPLIGKVVKFGVAWKENLGSIQERMKAFAKNTKLVIQGFGELLQKGEITGPLVDELRDNNLVGWVGKLMVIFDRAKTVFESFWKAFSTAVLSGAESLEDAFPAFSGIVDLFKEGGENSDEFAKKLPIEAFKNFGTEAGTALGKLISTLDKLDEAWAANADDIKLFWAAIVGLAGVVGGIVHIFKGLALLLDDIVFALEKITNFGEPLGDFLEDIRIAGDPTAEQAAKTEAGIAPGQIVGKVLGAAVTGSIPGLGHGVGRAGGMLGGGAEVVREIKLILNSKLEVDGKKLAEVVQEKQVEASEESFDPFAQPLSVME